MANTTSIGRPYALAAFQFAREASILPAWKTFFAAAREIAENKAVAKLIADPRTASKDLLSLFEHVLAKVITNHQKNFLSLIAQNKRFDLLPAISASFDELCAELEKRMDVHLVTAVPVDDAFKSHLSKALVKRVKQEITLTSEIDPSILGGALIHLGDKVIDGSVRGKLARLLEFSLR